MRKWGILCAAIVVLAGCVGGGATLAPVSVYNPVGPRGMHHCEVLNRCVVATEKGSVHLSIGEQSALTIGFTGLGGDLDYYQDYLVSIKNIGDSDLFFDPNRVPGFDPNAALNPIRSREENLQSIRKQARLLSALGGNVNRADIEDLDAIIAEDRALTEARLAGQMLEAQVISPGEQVAGRIVVRAAEKSPASYSIAIPVGSDVHSVHYKRRAHIPTGRRKHKGAPLNVTDASFFDGRWLVTGRNVGGYVRMNVCYLRTEGNRIFEKCEDGTNDVLSGWVTGGVAVIEEGPDNSRIELIAVDQNTLEFDWAYGEGVYERQ